MAELPIGAELKSDGFRNIKIVKELGRGGQGVVYQISMDGKTKALKWYHESAIADKKQFYENLKNNIQIGSPASCFLWPQDSVVSKEYRSFGYIMDLRPSEYIGMPKFLLKQNFDSLQARASAMINIVNGFRILHNQGFSYQDLNDGNFFINPHNGDVLICDNDNVSYPGYSTGILGKSRYMAPEIVLGQKMPDKATDRFSLALLLFELACKSHPLEGAGSTPPCMTPSIEKVIYGSNPVFIFDPTNTSNRPIRGVHVNAIKRWPQLPDYLRNAFERAFSKEAMTYKPESKSYAAPRIIERDWLLVLTQFRNSIVPCSCKNEEFVSNENFVCSSCGKNLPIASSIKTSRHTVPAYPGVKIMRIEIENCSDDQAITPVAEVLAAPGMKNNPAGFGIKNVSKDIWRCTTTTGQQRNLHPNEVMPAIPGIKVFIGKSQFEII